MQTFLEDTLFTLQQKHTDLSKLTLIFPSKRAGGFFKNFISKHAVTTSFLPKIVSIEEFIQDVSDLTIINNTELLFKSYSVYLNTKSFTQKEDFESFNSWAVTLLNDFNEIDRYLVNPKDFFNYLGSIKSMERWNLKEEKTELIQNYLKFWRKGQK